MSLNLNLDYLLNVNYLPLSSQPRLVYLLLETRAEPAAGHAAPVNLGLVVDSSRSMFIRLVSPDQFDELAAMGLLQEVMTDGVPSWQTQHISQEVLSRFPRKIDFVRQALHT